MFVEETTRSKIARLLDLGLSPPEIARRFGLAVPTVSYHVRRLNGGGDTTAGDDPPGGGEGSDDQRAALPAVRTQSSTRTAVGALQAAGLKAEATRFLGNKVRQQEPKAGQAVEQGSTVKILLSFF